MATSFQIVYCVYYFMAAIIAFYIYREFKAAAFEKNPAIAGYFQQRNNAVGDANEPQSYAEDNSNCEIRQTSPRTMGTNSIRTDPSRGETTGRCSRCSRGRGSRWGTCDRTTSL